MLPPLALLPVPAYLIFTIPSPPFFPSTNSGVPLFPPSPPPPPVPVTPGVDGLVSRLPAP